ncbi:MAG: hypothetical protein FWE09_00875 [Treponema sp.]|nr:hypothetical protein [Treponema sp.]
MTIGELADLLGAEICQDIFPDNQIHGAYASDLLSDVMANAKGGALITIQAHRNTVAVAAMKKIPAIIVCNSRPVPRGMIDAAREQGIAILRSSESQFAVSGKVWEMLKENSEA